MLVSPKTDLDYVKSIMRKHPNASVRAWACALGWIHPNGTPQAWRVHNALAELAISREVQFVVKERQWRLVKK
jgi:hypothetical protein